MCMTAGEVEVTDVCEKFEAPKNAKFIGKAFSLAKINNGEVVFGKKCYEIMGKKRDMEFYFSDDQLSSIGVTLSFTGAGTAGKQLFGEMKAKGNFLLLHIILKILGDHFLGIILFQIKQDLKALRMVKV